MGRRRDVAAGTGKNPLPRAYCATGADEGHDLDTRTDDDPAPDRYLIQFWPDPDGPVPDRIIRQTSEMAAYWHGFAREQPPPPSPDEQAEMAAAEERARARRQHEAEKSFREAVDRALWDEYRPSERMRAAGGGALAKLDPDLADTLEAASPETQRYIARWVTRRALAEARLTGMPWIAAALAAMDADESPPFPFDGDDRPAWPLLYRRGAAAHDRHLPRRRDRQHAPAIHGIPRAARRPRPRPPQGGGQGAGRA
jgi:hypothetical protein